MSSTELSTAPSAPSSTKNTWKALYFDDTAGKERFLKWCDVVDATRHYEAHEYPKFRQDHAVCLLTTRWGERKYSKGMEFKRWEVYPGDQQPRPDAVELVSKPGFMQTGRYYVASNVELVPGVPSDKAHDFESLALLLRRRLVGTSDLPGSSKSATAAGITNALTYMTLPEEQLESDVEFKLRPDGVYAAGAKTSAKMFEVVRNGHTSTIVFDPEFSVVAFPSADVDPTYKVDMELGEIDGFPSNTVMTVPNFPKTAAYWSFDEAESRLGQRTETE